MLTVPFIVTALSIPEAADHMETPGQSQADILTSDRDGFGLQMCWDHMVSAYCLQELL